MKTYTKITYDNKGIIIRGANATTDDIQETHFRKYVTNNQLDNIRNISGINTGDQDLSNLLVTTNQIFEFGKFLPNYKATIKPKLPERIPVHQEPNTFKFDWEHSTEPDGLPF